MRLCLSAKSNFRKEGQTAPKNPLLESGFAAKAKKKRIKEKKNRFFLCRIEIIFYFCDVKNDNKPDWAMV